MADVYTYRYGPIAKDFLTLVVSPSLDALDAQAKHWQESEDLVSGFIISDLNELIYKTRMAFCLSIQSLWEQQIRTYLAGCQHANRIWASIRSLCLTVKVPTLCRRCTGVMN